MAAQSGRDSPFQGSDPFQYQRRRRWYRGSFRSRFEDLMEAHARIELAMLAALLNAPAQVEAGGSPSNDSVSPSGDPVHESQGPYP